MSIAQVLRTIARVDGGDGLLDERDAAALFGGLLDGGMDELEMGAVLGTLAMRPLGASELAGFCLASASRTTRLHFAPAGSSGRAVAPVSIPSYSGTREHANLMPALALLLVRFGVPVLVHGPLEAQGRVAGAAVLRELGVLPCSGAHDVQLALATAGIAFVPTALLSPAMAQVIALRGRLGIPNCAQLVARLLDPFGGACVRLVPACGNDEREVLAAVLEDMGANALLFLGAEGEAFADPQQRPAIEHFGAGGRRLPVRRGDQRNDAGRAGPCRGRRQGCGALDYAGAVGQDSPAAAAVQPARVLPVRRRVHRRLQPGEGDRRGAHARACGRLSGGGLWGLSRSARVSRTPRHC